MDALKGESGQELVHAPAGVALPVLPLLLPQAEGAHEDGGVGVAEHGRQHPARPRGQDRR